MSFRPVLTRGIVISAALTVALLGFSWTAPQLTPLAHAQAANAVMLYNDGIDAYNQGNVNKALSLFEKAVATDGNYADAYYNIGSIYYQKGNYTKAESAFRKVVTLMPNDAQAKYNLAMSLERLDKLAEALKYYQMVPSSDKKYAQARNKIDQINQQIAAAQKLTEQAREAAKTDEERMAELIHSGGAPASLDYSNVAVKAFSKGFAGPTGMTIGPEGYLFVANYTKNEIHKVSATGDKTVFAKSDVLGGPIGLVYNPKSQDMYVANYLKNNVARITPKGEVSVIASGLKKPYNLYLDLYNNALYVSEQETNAISKIELPVR